MRTFTILVAAGLGFGLPSLAQAGSFTGAEQIVRGDLSGAEQALVAQHRLTPGDPDVLLNLAAIYVQTERTAEARALYREVLATPDEDMTLVSGAFVSSHRLAGAALQRLDTRAVAAR